MYQIITPNTYTTETFHLVRNRMDVGRWRIILGFGVVVIPMLFANSIYYSVLELKSPDLIIALCVTGLILLNIAFFLLNRLSKGNRTLIFGYNELRIIENSKVMKILPFEHIKITKLEYGFDENNTRPAVRISGKDFKCMTIGSRTPINHWKTGNNKEQIDCTEYILKTENEWFRFRRTLEQFL